jgi:hypothetical protein
MARTAIAIQSVSGNSGAQLTSVTPDQANGNMFDNDGRTRLVVHNGDATSKTVTITGVTCSHGRTSNIVQAVAAGERAVFGPFEPSLFNQPGPSDQGKVYVDWSASTSVKVGTWRHA